MSASKGCGGTAYLRIPNQTLYFRLTLELQLENKATAKHRHLTLI